MNNNQYQNVNQYQNTNQEPFQNIQPKQSTNSNEPENKTQANSKILIIILLILVLALTGIILYMQFGNKKTEEVINDNPTIALLGEKKVTITEGDQYIEDGYSAKSYSGEDLTSKVEVNNNVKSTVPGTYEIVYSVVDDNQKLVSVKRTIVVEKLTLSLNLLGETTTNILKGNKYVDAGYEAYDTKDGNLDEKVMVSGDVNPNVLGSYKIIYSVKNSLNKSVEKERVINVVPKKGEFTIELLSNFNNDKSAVITLDVIGTNYSYAILPNNAKVTTKTAFYEVDSSGNYEFRVFDVYGNEYVKEIYVELEVEKLSLDNSLIKNLYNYISSMAGNYKNFYQTVKVTVDNASKESLLEGAYISLGKSEATNSELQVQASKIYNITNSTIISTKTSVTSRNVGISYNGEKWTGEGTSINSHQAGTLLRADKIGNYIYLYDNYKFIDYTNLNNDVPINGKLTKVYSGSDKQVIVGNLICKVDNCGFLIGSPNEENAMTLTASETMYKHTFKQKGDGTYYWVSSEPENNINLNDPLVIKLYNYISNSYGIYKNFYQTIKVTKANTSKESLLEGAYVSLGKSEVTNTEFQNHAKQIFNMSGSIPTTIKIQNTGINVKYENGKWLGTNPNKHTNGNIIKAIKNGDEINLYDSYEFIDIDNINNNVAINGELVKIYSGSDKKVLVGNITCKVANCTLDNSNTTNVNINSNKTLYMHTFKMNDFGEYYWISSAQVK